VLVIAGEYAAPVKTNRTFYENILLKRGVDETVTKLALALYDSGYQVGRMDSNTRCNELITKIEKSLDRRK
jgi:hypothetical protein